MKKIITIIGIFGLILLQAQQVGINTDTPKATLDMKKDQSLAETTPQGVLFPRLTTLERAKFTDVEKGMMIYNLDKECIEIYTGIQNGVAQWDCLSSTAFASAQNITISPAGFEGAYVAGVPMNATNKVNFELKNNTFSEIKVDFSDAVSIENGGSNMGVVSGQNKNVSLAGGASIVVSFSLSGTPVEGMLTAKFKKLSLQADQSTHVGLGSATMLDETTYVASLIDPVSSSYSIQGVIKNLPEKMTIKIPYKQGHGAFYGYTVTVESAPGEDGSTRNFTLDIPAGNFSGTVTGTITVDGNGEYLVKKQSAGDIYDIVTFPISLGGSTSSVVIKGIGAIPDDNSGNGTHKYLYRPLLVDNGLPLTFRYRKYWLNVNVESETAWLKGKNFDLNVNEFNHTHNVHSNTKLYGRGFTDVNFTKACPYPYVVPNEDDMNGLISALQGMYVVGTPKPNIYDQTKMPNFPATGKTQLVVGPPIEFEWVHEGYGFYWVRTYDGSLKQLKFQLNLEPGVVGPKESWYAPVRCIHKAYSIQRPTIGTLTH